MQLPFDTYGLRRHNGLPLEEFYHSVENVPDLAARGVSQELYRRIFVNELAQVTGLEMPPRDEDAVKRQVFCAWLAAFACCPVGLPYCCWITHRERARVQAFDADLRAWQANATEQLRAIVPGAVVKTRMRVKGEYQIWRGEQGEVKKSYVPTSTERFIVIALTPEEGSLLQDEPHISGDADKIPPECMCVFCACEGRPDGSCEGETLCCCKFTVKPGAPEGLDYYEWKRDERCAVPD